jgi:steroid 5-alpha reductase family enzyme
MFSLGIYLQGLGVVAVAALFTWVLSLIRRNVAIVDSLWSLMFVLAAFTYAAAAPTFGPRALVVLALVSVWALRLSIYITVRNWGHGEDRRYQAIRARNQPHFEVKSLYLIFAFQALLAWVISLPLLGAILNPGPLGALDILGALLWLVGFWRYTRHPNYFGDFSVWWGFYLIAVAAGAWWSILGPIGMSVLLMRVSGVTLLEKDIGERRPQYADYIRRTNAFFPGIPKR